MKTRTGVAALLAALTVAAANAESPARFARIEGGPIVLYERPVSLSAKEEPAAPVEVERVPRSIEIDPSSVRTKGELTDKVVGAACHLYSVARYLEPILTDASTLPAAGSLVSVGVPGLGMVRLGYTREHGIGFYWYPGIIQSPYSLFPEYHEWVSRISDETRTVHLDSKEELDRIQGTPPPTALPARPFKQPKLAL